MLGRHTTLVGRIMVAVALFTVLTGSGEEYGGMIVHVELAQVEHPVPQDVSSWDDVTVSLATGDRYYWAPSGYVTVQRVDGSMVRARNDFDHARNSSRVSLLQSRSGEWFITAVEKRGEGDEFYEPDQLGPRTSEEPIAVSDENPAGDTGLYSQ